MSRHSKNSTATTHFTYHEKMKAGHGTLKSRYGKDSQIPFGYCCLSLAPAENPMITPSGFIYSKEAIFENLLAQKQTIQSQKIEYENYLEKQKTRKDEEKLSKEKEMLGRFISSNDSLENNLSKTSKYNDSKTKKQLISEISTKVDHESRIDKQKSLKRTSFWVPGFTPEDEVRIEKPSDQTTDPMTGEALKLKQLMPAKFVWSDTSEGNDRHVLCALTKKAITHQAAVLLKPSGQIILESCLKDMVLASMQCPITGVKLRKKDIISLQSGGSSYSAHSEVEAKKYRPSMT